MKKTYKLENFEKVLQALKRSASTPILEPRDLSGIIKDFELAYELAWKTLKLFLKEQGQETGPPKDVLRKAFRFNLITDEEIWLSILNDRNLSTHVYDEGQAKLLVGRIISDYVTTFELLLNLLKSTAEFADNGPTGLRTK